MEEFRAKLHECETDMAKFQLCEEKRDQLLHNYTAVELEIAAFDMIMSSECAQYRQKRHGQYGRPKSLSRNYEAEWDRFIGIAEASSKDL
jgi:hypothetical protein